MPFINTRGVSSVRGYGFGSKSYLGSLWMLSNYTSTTNYSDPQSFNVDSSGNFYNTLGNTTSSVYSLALSKSNPTTNTNTTVVHYTPSSSPWTFGINDSSSKLDKVNNYILSFGDAYKNNGTTNYYAGVTVANISTSGTLSYIKNIWINTTGLYNNVYVTSASVISSSRLNAAVSGNVWTSNGSGGYNISSYSTLISINPTNNSITNYYTFNLSAIGSYGINAYMPDSTGDIYLMGIIGSGQPYYRALIKMDSSFTVLWSQQFGTGDGSLGQVIGQKVSVDDNGNIYLFGGYASGTTGYLKVSSTGNNILSSNISSVGSDSTGSCYGTWDTNGNVYIALNSSTSVYYAGTYYSYNYVNIIKYNSSGVVQWVRRIVNNPTPSFPSQQPNATNLKNNVFVIGSPTISNNNITICLKVDVTANQLAYMTMPIDGSLLGSVSITQPGSSNTFSLDVTTGNVSTLSTSSYAAGAVSATYYAKTTDTSGLVVESVSTTTTNITPYSSTVEKL